MRIVWKDHYRSDEALIGILNGVDGSTTIGLFALSFTHKVIRNEEGEECYWHQPYKKLAMMPDANDVHPTFNFYSPLSEIEKFKLHRFKNYMQGFVILLNIIPLL